MTHVDLFSGIGGFALAAHWAGFETEVFCESDEFCQKVLRKHWPATPIVDDILGFDGTRHAGADLLTGGFPCQPYSCAGKQLGNTDDRALWPEMRRVIAESKPRWIVAENVPGIVNMALDGVLSDLEAEGYESGALVIPACAVNAPHRRDRVWIVAYAKGSRCQAFSPNDMGNGKQRTVHAACADDVANPNSKSPDRATIARRQCDRGQIKSRLGGMAHGIPERMDGHFDEEPSTPRTATGIPDRAARLRSLGNAIVPQVAYQIISNIAELENAA